MDISSINSMRSVYQTYINGSFQNTGTVNKQITSNTSITDGVTPLRDRMLNQIEKTSGDNNAAERLLDSYSKPDTGGVLIAANSMPDLKDPEGIRRFQRINQLFEQENKQVEISKRDIISQGQAEGKTAQNILYDLVSMYDSQSDLFKLGRSWEGDFFSFDSNLSEGWSKVLQFTPDVIDTTV